MSWDCRAELYIAGWNSMVFKNFRFQVVLRVFILLAVITVLAWCLVHAYYLRSIYLGIAGIVLVIEFVAYVDRFNRDLKSFMVSLLQRDFTTHYQSSGRSKSFDELYGMLNRISAVFKTISSEKEVQYRYLEMLVDHLQVGILSMDERGDIQLANQALKDLLRKDVIMNLRSLESLDPALVNALRQIRTGETHLVKVRVHNELLQLSVHASEFMLEEKYHKLISMQNIRNELDAREMEAWQKLIRVLTHEIMNSVSPVISLSQTMHGLVDQHRDNLRSADPGLYEALDKGLEAIKFRSEGLYHFTQSYRKLTGIPKLSLKETNLRDILLRVRTLMENKMNEKGITFTTGNEDVPIVADPDLMEHVLINLLLNAIEAVAEAEGPRIEVRGFRDAMGHVSIYVRDNGEGIDEATAEKIFIPFFTTRKNGSGIGLAITNQILQLHHAHIHFTSEKGKGTEFVIVM
jgi:two-component system, NtrC family, nitrogen regulation sensor histidine kinase NtrY